MSLVREELELQQINYGRGFEQTRGLENCSLLIQLLAPRRQVRSNLSTHRVTTIMSPTNRSKLCSVMKLRETQ